jgi:hypothetical protein
MANCDWGSPCDCRDCRTKLRTEICPNCGFDNIVEIEGSGQIKVDRKGVRYMDFTYPSGPDQSLQCYKCKFVIDAVAYYSGVAERECQLNCERDEVRLTAPPCMLCGENIRSVGEHYGPIVLTEHNGKQLCHKCLAEAIQAETQDPSDKDSKYVFNKRTMQWELKKVRILCESCGAMRWLNAENRWKKFCSRCYKGQPGR